MTQVAPPNTTPPKLSMTLEDVDVLERLVKTPGGRRAARRLLEAELVRAIAVGRGGPPPYSRVGSLVTYEDCASGRHHKVELAAPDQTRAGERRVSVLSPIGRALIGLTAGAATSWIDGRGTGRQLIVISVEQPRGGLEEFTSIR